MSARSSNSRLIEIFRSNRDGALVGAYSVCSAHSIVLRAALELARERRQIAIIEATCNQVNQYGGYTGMTPVRFANFVREMAADVGLPTEDLVLGGDHLGPQPWRSLPAAEAMAHAIAMVQAYAGAGFGKLHLDCSMACADDPVTLTDKVIAERAAQLALAAEASAPDRASLLYIVGTEVPAPGGMGEGHMIHPTLATAVGETWHAHRIAFDKSGLSEAFERIVGVVVQPGLDFGNETIVHFTPEGAASLSASVLTLGDAVFEAHSTDYQTPASYLSLIAQHFAILKVGPAATFAVREAIYALDALARELPGWQSAFAVRAAMEAAMTRNPAHWASYYGGDSQQQAYLRHFSFSDRLRYYWTEPAVAQTVDRLFNFLDAAEVPLPLISQYFSQHWLAVTSGKLMPKAASLCIASVQTALTPYANACGDHAAMFSAQ